MVTKLSKILWISKSLWTAILVKRRCNYPIDCDLQYPELFETFIEQWKKDYKIVYGGKRTSR